MNAFFRRSFIEYKRQKDLKKAKLRQTQRVKSILMKTSRTSGGESFDRDELHRRALLLLMPLVEVAWADGRVSRPEMDAIVETADAYTLVDGSAGYRELIERLLSRPAPSAVGRMWQDFHRFLENLPFYERQTVTFGLLAQAQFVAEQSSDSVIGFLRGERVNKNEQEALRIVAEQLEKAKEALEEIDTQKAVAKTIERENYFVSAWELSAQGTNGCGEIQSPLISAAEDFDKLIPLVPLVKTAWAEGRVTRRERELIFEAAKKMGIRPESGSYRRLSDWLDLHPTEEFYDQSLEQLRGEIEKLPEEDRTLRRLDVLSDCVNVAEASGGTRRFPSGGAKICDEEILAVKRIASRLNGGGDRSINRINSKGETRKCRPIINHFTDKPEADTPRRKKMKVPTPTNVLFLEDDGDTRELVAYTLTQAGIIVISAETVAEAQELAATRDVDLYLLDGLIQNGDSLKLCSDLRRLHPLKPIVFYSGLAYKDDILRGLAAGATAYLIKPYSGDLAEEILRFVHSESSSNAVQSVFLNREEVMKAFETEEESASGESVKIVDVPAGYIPTNWTESFEVQQPLIPVKLRNTRTMRASRGIF